MCPSLLPPGTPPEHRQGQLPNKPRREGDSAPLAVHLLKGKVAHPNLDPSVCFLHAPFGKTSGKFHIKNRRLGGAGQGQERKQCVEISLHETSLFQAPLHQRGGGSSEAVPSCPHSLCFYWPVYLGGVFFRGVNFFLLLDTRWRKAAEMGHCCGPGGLQDIRVMGSWAPGPALPHAALEKPPSVGAEAPSDILDLTSLVGF